MIALTVLQSWLAIGATIAATVGYCLLVRAVGRLCERAVRKLLCEERSS